MISFPMQTQRAVFKQILAANSEGLTEDQKMFIETWLVSPRKTRQVFRKLRRKYPQLLPIDAMSAAIQKTIPVGSKTGQRAWRYNAKKY